MDYELVKRRLQRSGVWSKKELGQHFLIDDSALECILETAGLEKSDTVMEIGPGLGVLSKFLLQKAGRVLAFEYDPDMQGILKQDLPNLEVIGGDVLRTAPAELEKLGDYKVVANIPYQITSPLLRMLVEEANNKPSSLTLLVQKEVGKRLAADPNKTGRGHLSVLCQYFAELKYIQDVPASSFWPAPKVDSGIIHMKMRSKRPLPLEDERPFFTFVRQLFLQPRKQLKNVLAGMLRVETAVIAQYFDELGLPTTVRAQELSNEQWLVLYKNQFKG